MFHTVTDLTQKLQAHLLDQLDVRRAVDGRLRNVDCGINVVVTDIGASGNLLDNRSGMYLSGLMDQGHPWIVFTYHATDLDITGHLGTDLLEGGLDGGVVSNVGPGRFFAVAISHDSSDEEHQEQGGNLE